MLILTFKKKKKMGLHTPAYFIHIFYIFFCVLLRLEWMIRIWSIDGWGKAILLIFVLFQAQYS